MFCDPTGGAVRACSGGGIYATTGGGGASLAQSADAMHAGITPTVTAFFKMRGTMVSFVRFFATS
jgi:hypothetical protein